MIERAYHQDGAAPEADQLFVFGSNMRGAHGGGSARAAYDLYGAAWGVASGITGRCYAIPTLDADHQQLPLFIIAEHVTGFILHARNTPEQRYFVTRIGCGIAGFSDSDIAPMFRNAPANCSFAQQWKPFLEAA